jgi:hypothetical protein
MKKDKMRLNCRKGDKEIRGVIFNNAYTSKFQLILCFNIDLKRAWLEDSAILSDLTGYYLAKTLIKLSSKFEPCSSNASESCNSHQLLSSFDRDLKNPTSYTVYSSGQTTMRVEKRQFAWEFSQLSCAGQTRTRVAWLDQCARVH